MSTERWPIDRWHDLFRTLFRPEHAAFFPHKIFRWDAQGIYRDCFFPFPCEHLLGGEAILGKSVRDVLPKKVGYTVERTLKLALQKGVPQDVQCTLPSGKQCFIASIRIFPYDSEVLGFVTDHDLSGAPVIKVTSDHPLIRFLSRPAGIWPITANLSR